ncbi:MAG TPA: hypothetical protein VKS21_08470, partial [Spirochaetota bacterium]|nr:hypothetical protein [Spirochaetota bacterium]
MKVITKIIFLILLVSALRATDTAILKNNFLHIKVEKEHSRYYMQTEFKIHSYWYIAKDNEQQNTYEIKTVSNGSEIRKERRTLLYPGRDPEDGEYSSYTTIIIDGKQYIFGEDKRCITRKAAASNGLIRTTAEIDNIVIHQDISLVKSINSEAEHAGRLLYTFSNTDSAAHEVSVRIFQDISPFPDRDHVFRVPGYGVIRREKAISTDIPYMWYMYEHLDRYGMGIVSRLDIPLSEKPAKIVFAADEKFKDELYEVSTDNEETLHNAAVAVYFDKISLKPGRQERAGIDTGLLIYEHFTQNDIAISLAGMDLIKNTRPALITMDILNLKDEPLKNLTFNFKLPPEIVKGLGSEAMGSHPRAVDTMTYNRLQQQKQAAVLAGGSEMHYPYYLAASNTSPNDTYPYQLELKYDKGSLICDAQIKVQNFFRELFQSKTAGGPTELELALLKELKKEILFSGDLSQAFNDLLNNGIEPELLSNTLQAHNTRNRRLDELRQRVAKVLGRSKVAAYTSASTNKQDKEKSGKPKPDGEVKKDDQPRQEFEEIPAVDK